MQTKKDKPSEKSIVNLYFARIENALRVPEMAEDVMRLAIETTLACESFFHDVEVSVTLCDGAYIRELNAQYREKDAETDVLSFPLFDEEEEDPIAETLIPLGDIVLNVDRAAEQGAELGHSVLREIAFLTVHSMLHLLGYDHERSFEEEEKMCERQREIIAQVETSFEKAEGKTL